MTTTTAEYWSVLDRTGADVPLQTLAQNIETWGDDRQSVMELRGDDVTIPWVPGDAIVTQKVPAARVISMGMWVRGCQSDGSVPTSPGARSLFETNWQRIRELLFNRGEPFTLIKRFYDQSNTLRTVKATAQFASGLKPGMMGTTGAKFTVDLKLADPFFYGDPINLAFDSAVGAITPTILGDWYARRVSISALASASGCTTPSINISSAIPLISMAIQKVVLASQTITIDVPSQLARVNGVLSSALVTHLGSRDWLRLHPGVCTITPLAAANSWSGTLTYYPAWF